MSSCQSRDPGRAARYHPAVSRRSLLVAQATTHQSPECPPNTVRGDSAPDGIPTLPPSRAGAYTHKSPKGLYPYPPHAMGTAAAAASLSGRCRGVHMHWRVASATCLLALAVDRRSIAASVTAGRALCAGAVVLCTALECAVGVRVYYLNCAASGVGDVLAVGRCRWAVIYVLTNTRALVVLALASPLGVVVRAAILLARRVVVLLALRVVVLLRVVVVVVGVALLRLRQGVGLGRRGRRAA